MRNRANCGTQKSDERKTYPKEAQPNCENLNKYSVCYLKYSDQMVTVGTHRDLFIVLLKSWVYNSVIGKSVDYKVKILYQIGSILCNQLALCCTEKKKQKKIFLFIKIRIA